MSGTGTKEAYGAKNATYYFDDMLDEAGRVAGHGAGNSHGELPHLQVHDENGYVFRINFLR